MDTNVFGGIIYSFFRFIGGSFCHQLAERSFNVCGYQLPVCARCTGIMIGIFSCVCFIYLAKRHYGNKPFGIVTLLIMICGYLFLAFDGLSSYTGLRESTNFSRIISGILAGYIFPVFFTLIRNFDENSRNDKKIMGVFDIMFVLSGALIIAALILVDSFIIWFFVSLIIALSTIFFFANIYMLVIKLIKPSVQKKRQIILATAFACATIVVFSSINHILI